MFVDVTASDGGVLFSFTNAGPGASSLTDVYFDDGPLDSMTAIINSAGVAFTGGASPGDLPGGNDLVPMFDADFSADSDAPVAHNGVNPGENLGIQFSLVPGMTVDDVIALLVDGSLRVGIHVQAFEDGGSESFILTQLPEPAVFALLASVLAGLTAARARRS